MVLGRFLWFLIIELVSLKRKNCFETMGALFREQQELFRNHKNFLLTARTIFLKP